MQTFSLTLQLVIAAVFSSLISGEDCVWNKDNDYPGYPPLLINKDTWISLKAVKENDERVVRIAENTVVVVACSGTLIQSLQEEVVEGFCEGGQNLNIGGSSYTISDLGCSSVVKNSISPTLNPCGADDQGVTTLIGFNVPGYSFYPTINVCFYTDTETNMYSEHVVYGENVDAGDGNPDKPYFVDDVQFYPTIDPNECYLTANQDEYFTSLMGDPDFIDLDTSIYFARGHMAPNADFLTDMEADASYHYLNAVPQWQVYNGGNWMYLESDVRDLAESHRSNLHIFTGPWQNLVLNDVNNNPTTIYICNSQE
ncbi:hypothetical protein Anas_12321 [Armadillidium nasatum]|uniref:DNA/RNA non-specific endonuclease/pyrophosphatase/phosphodiesterase domain-containing protein n=1 Tax=Armadillidium nasatum TaxID=96803 RepID=A0A5N5TDD5_9CRUS|nr:hypothetical protein Anas_12321 [Armadillidium nasatum]